MLNLLIKHCVYWWLRTANRLIHIFYDTHDFHVVMVVSHGIVFMFGVGAGLLWMLMLLCA